MTCAQESRSIAEPVVGTAPTETAQLFVEQPGPWGKDATAENRMPAEVLASYDQLATDLAARMYLVRRGDRKKPPDRHVWLWQRSDDGTLITSEGTFDNAALASAAGLVPATQPTPLFVCTNGSRDRCCAELGRDLVRQLRSTLPSHQHRLWEVSHLGGHRFAPTGCSQGEFWARLTVASGQRLLTQDPAQVASCDSELLRRGPFGFHPAAQAAIVSATELGEVSSVEGQPARSADDVWQVDGKSAGREWQLLVRETAGPPQSVSCGKAATNPIHWQVVS